MDDTNHALIHPVTLQLPQLPAPLEGMRAAHLTDLHINRPRRRHDVLAKLLASLSVDFVFLTGDYMSYPGDEPAAENAMRRLCDAMSPKVGVYGVYGNHDTPLLRDRLMGLPVNWLHNHAHSLPGLPMVITGMETIGKVMPDSLAMIEHRTRIEPAPQEEHHAWEQDQSTSGKPMQLMLCHHPTYLPVAADLGMDVMLSGHTHGGQCRLPGKIAIRNSTDLPFHLTSGVMRHKNTWAMVSRGLGEVLLPLRVCCPPQLPVYTFKRGPGAGQDASHTCNAQWW